MAALFSLRTTALAGDYEDYSSDSWNDRGGWEEESYHDYDSDEHNKYKYSNYGGWSDEYDNDYSKHSDEENNYHEEDKNYGEHEYDTGGHHEDLEEIDWEKLWSWLHILLTHFKGMGMSMPM